MRLRELSMAQKLSAAAVCLLLLLLAALYVMPKDPEQPGAPLRVGAGDDITGILLSEVAACAEASGRDDFLVGSYKFADCCAGAAQWALQAEEIDLGFYCAQAAMAMVKESDVFELYGPIIMNGEVMATRIAPDDMRTVGIPRKRSFLSSISGDAYPLVEDWQELNRSYLLYTVESGEVDGAILDVADAHYAGSGMYFFPASDTPYISYCLVVRRDLADTEVFSQFLTYYEEAVDRLNDPEALISVMGMDAPFWTMSGTEFLHLS